MFNASTSTTTTSSDEEKKQVIASEGFRELGEPESDFPCKKDYMDIYDSTLHLTNEDVINRFARYMLECSIVRREYSAKKYYADCYDFYAGKRAWPSFYDEQQSKVIFIADYIAPENSVNKP